MADDLHFLNMAARLALRGHGGAEPNPMVGAVIVSRAGEVVGWGYHRTCGGPHAEIIALQRAGSRARGATLYCTLEPCDHTGRTGPCTQAIIDAGIARLVYARRDPNPTAAGGAATLLRAGIDVQFNDRCRAAIAVSDPFTHTVATGLPWVTAKWAQTIDGKIATRTGESQWISNTASRRLVHQERGRVDAILTGIGTVLHDDPMLTARCARKRRIAKRVVIDPNLRTTLESKLVQTMDVAPTIIACDERVVQQHPDRAAPFHERGVQLITAPVENGSMSVACVLRTLVTQHDVATVLVEAGTGLLSCLFAQRLVNEAWVFIAPLLLGDEQASEAVRGMQVQHLVDGCRLKLQHMRRRGDDLIARYRVLHELTVSGGSGIEPAK